MPWGPPDRTNPRVLADPVERSAALRRPGGTTRAHDKAHTRRILRGVTGAVNRTVFALGENAAR
ncbi:hypothetical protein EDF44_0751 [Rathayibacter sp. PhB185]|nr:hypothetical protein EDF45_0751 [Rathayibacter sp. PhB186]ROS55608.1 hypothetical protein EDF44_0751 [Rathayibacter sp. PhB185]